ncbi:MAG: phosphatase PAP2 family protein [Planctomycetota bacterium]|jgi:membrane-associated phospholipid phosphatase
MRALWRGKIGLGVVFAVLILAGGCANQPNDHASVSVLGDFLKADLDAWPDRVIDDSKDTFSRADNITALLVAGAASIAMNDSDADDDIAEHSDQHQVIDGFGSETLDTLGHPGFHFAATGLWYAASVDNDDVFNRERAWTMMTALAINGLTTAGLKAIRDNDTPNGKRYAWPSGHTSSSFTVASVLDEFYGPKVGIPAYMLAGLVGYRMMDEGDHWASDVVFGAALGWVVGQSDVVFGAALGWVVGHTVAGRHKELEIAGFKVLPYTASPDGPVMGINLVKRF